LKKKNVVIGIAIAPVVIVATIIIFILLYAWGPVSILRLTPYEETQRRITFPQWINNDEICYVEYVLQRDRTFFEQGKKFILFIKNPIIDIYIYREKAGQPETKKLIKHIARRHIQPSQSLEGSLDTNLGFRVYDNGKKIFLYYTYYEGIPRDFRYITLDVTGRNFKERTPPIIPFDISQDGEKIYGVLHGNFEEQIENYILEYSLRDNTIKRLLEIAENRFERSRRGDIKDLKLLSKDKLIFSYHTDGSMPNPADYIYLVDVFEKSSQLLDKLLLFGPHRDAISKYYAGEYTLGLPNGFNISKDGKFLLAGNIGIYEKKNDTWVEIRDFYKEYPSLSPDGGKITFIDVLMKKDKRNWPLFAGRKLSIINFEGLFEIKE